MRRLQPSIRTHGPQRRRHSAKIRVLSPARPGGPVPGRGIRPAGAHLGPLLARNSRARTRDFTESSWRLVTSLSQVGDPRAWLARSDAMPAAVSEESRTRQRDGGPGSLGRLRLSGVILPACPIQSHGAAAERLRRLSCRRVGGSCRCLAGLRLNLKFCCYSESNRPASRRPPASFDVRRLCN